MTPFAGWAQYNGDATEILRTTDSFTGNYACNLTGLSVASVGIFREAYIPLNPSDMTSFRWRLDEIGDDNAYARIRLRFGSDSLIYVLGAGSDFSLSNASNVHNIVPESFNETGSWNQLRVNLTADFEEAFGSSSGVAITQIEITIFAGTNQRLSILFDDMHFIDGAPPVIDSFAFLPAAPMYYDTVDVTVYTHDDRSGIAVVYVDYYNGSWSSLSAVDMDGYYVATIPAHPYDTTIEFQISVFDGSYNNAYDNNGGARYTYTVGDDVAPTLTITNPANNSDQEGLLSIIADATDPGAGIMYVEFDPDVYGPNIDATAPYSYDYNLDAMTLGLHYIDVTAYDNVGNQTTRRHYFTVVDTVDPGLDSPDDVEFTVGETGYIIDWNPTDTRSSHYVILKDGVTVAGNNWNDTSEHIIIDLDGLAAEEYNYTCIVYDDAGNSAVDTVIVTVNEAVTTSTTSDTTTTDTTTTDPGTTNTTTPTGGPTGGGDIMTPLLIVAGIGVVGILLIVFVVLPKMKKT